jgi:hypothetical protein
MDTAMSLVYQKSVGETLISGSGSEDAASVTDGLGLQYQGL